MKISACNFPEFLLGVWTIYITHDFERNSPVWLKRIPEVIWRDMNIGLQIRIY